MHKDTYFFIKTSKNLNFSHFKQKNHLFCVISVDDKDCEAHIDIGSDDIRRE